MDPPDYAADGAADDTADNTAGSAGDLDWKDVKQNLFASGSPSCDEERRTGSWVDVQCDDVSWSSTTKYTPEERWKAVDGNSAWDDAMYRWRNCDRPGGNVAFSSSISNFFHSLEGPACDFIVDRRNCNAEQCHAHNDDSTPASEVTGAGSYLVWNSLVRVHQVRTLTIPRESPQVSSF